MFGHCSGGGWTLLEVLGSSILLPQAYADVGGNQANLLSKKTDFTKYGVEEFASLGKARFNAVWSVFGERTSKWDHHAPDFFLSVESLQLDCLLVRPPNLFNAQFLSIFNSYSPSLLAKGGH